MNSLSWLIYFADVFNDLSIILGICSVVLFLYASCLTIYGASIKESVYHADFGGEKWTRGHQFQIMAFKMMVLSGLVLMVSAFLPSKETMYAVAASEVGESIINSSSVQKTSGKAFKALDAWLDSQVTKSSEGSEKAPEGK